MSAFFPLPEDLQKHLEEQATMQEMALDSYRHEVQGVFYEIDQESLRTLRHIMHNITCAQNPSSMAAYYEGLIAGAMMQRFNICPSCGVDHDKQAAELGDEQAAQQPDDPGTPVEATFTHGQRAQMLEYNLDDLWEGTDPPRFVGFVCLGCGMKYKSIEDRMVNDPDKCSGCIQKAKWG